MTRLLSHPLIILIFSLFSFFCFLSLKGTLAKTRISAENLGVLEQEIAQITSDVSSLEAQVEAASSPASQEKIIRNELLMQREGEVVIQLPNLAPPAPSPSPVATPKPWEEWQTVLFP